MMAQDDSRDLPASVLHVDRELASLVSVRWEVRGLDLRLDDGRHERGLALLVEVVRSEVDRIDRFHEEEPRLRRREIDPIRRPLRDRDVNVLPELQVAIFRVDDAFAVLDEVDLVPLAVPEEGVLRHRFPRLRDRERRTRAVDDRLAPADRIALMRHAAREDVIRLEDIRLWLKVGDEGGGALPRRLQLVGGVETNPNLSRTSRAETVEGGHFLHRGG